MSHSASLARPPRMGPATYRIRRRILHPVYCGSRTLGMKRLWVQHIRCKTWRPHDSRLHTSRTSLSGAQLIQEGLGVLQIGGVEALGEPVVDFLEHLAGFVAFALPREEAREANRRL